MGDRHRARPGGSGRRRAFFPPQPEIYPAPPARDGLHPQPRPAPRLGNPCRDDLPRRAIPIPHRRFHWLPLGQLFRPLHRHSGLDIFSGGQPGVAPVYSAYDGYLTRLPDWKSSLIQRIPSDPLQPQRQIWLYYTHLANPQGNSLIDKAIPPGTNEVFVPAGTLLGHQGNFSGTPGSPTGVHLHISIVRDDGAGKFLNESRIENTIDPSPYFGMHLNANQPNEPVPGCIPSS